MHCTLHMYTARALQVRRCVYSTLHVSWVHTACWCQGACCSWLRSSTAPSESRPASISGASASTTPPDVRAANASTDSRLTTGAATAAAAVPIVDWRGVNAVKNLGTAATPPSTRSHEMGITDTTAGPPATASARAARPCASPTCPQPCSFRRALMPPPAAIPTSAHGPHCTLVAACPAPRRPLASASRQLFAAA